MRYFIGFFSLLGVVLFSVLFYSFVEANHLPKHFTLQAPNGNVNIERDSYDIPHIDALQSDDDAFYALGYMHAQDRFWQMEFQRRVAAGRLSEIFGKATIKQDEYLRTWGFYRAAILAWDALDPRTKKIVHAYTMGVNAYLATGKLPLPFKLLRYHPEVWTDIDSICWQKMMAWNLDNTWQLKIKNYQVAKQYGSEKINTIFPPYPLNAPTVLSETDIKSIVSEKSEPLINHAMIKRDARSPNFVHQDALEAIGFPSGPGKGSNSWVISGKLTKSGKPILANDPHLALAAPSLWYQAELKGPTLHVIGATIPGLPMVVIGHNDHIAWGVTSGYVDAQDLYIEDKNAVITTRKEIIHIKGAPDETLLVRMSQHGPIISDVTDAKFLGSFVALKWPALLPGDTTAQSFSDLNYAKNWQEFTAALSFFVAPSQNFLYADTDGNIGYYLPGKIPVRKGWSGAFPVEANQKWEWNGYIPFNQLPHVLNPSEGYIASANNKIIPLDYPYTLNFRWSVPPFRIERIEQLIHQNLPMDIPKTKLIQSDTQSLLWLALRDDLMKTIPMNDSSQTAIRILKNWNGQMNIDSPAATIFSYWYQELINAPLDVKDLSLKADPLLIINELKNQTCHSKGIFINCQSYLSETLSTAMQKLIQQHGDNINHWQWGKVHHVIFTELAIGKSKAIGWIWNRSVPTVGGDYTVNVGTYDPETMDQTHGASYRQIIDLSDFKNSVYVIPLGEQDNPFSLHYNNQLALWENSDYVPMK